MKYAIKQQRIPPAGICLRYNLKKQIVSAHRRMRACQTAHLENVLHLHLTLTQNSTSCITAVLELFISFSPQPLANHKLHESISTLFLVFIHVFPLLSLYLLRAFCQFSQVISYDSSIFLNFKWNCSWKVEKAMAPHSSTLAWKIPWTEEPGRLWSMGSRRVGHDWVTSLSLFTFLHWRRKWQPTPVFLPEESQGQRSLVGCHLWGRTESDTNEVT